MYAVVLCGGSGTRLWPLSRKNFPKQFLKLYSDKSLLQETFSRFKKIVPVENIVFVTNRDNYFNVLNQIKEMENDFDGNNILVEPASLNTAPAVAYAVKFIRAKRRASMNEIIVVSPADHYIESEKKFFSVVGDVFADIEDNIGTIGIVPTSAETGYGYIKKGRAFGTFFATEEFKEKPNRATAEKYLDSGEYVWNSGIYVFKMKTIARAFEKHAPEIYSALTRRMDDFLKDFSALPAVSLDVAISEKSEKMVVFPGDFGWSDIGSFDSLAEVLKNKDKNSKHVAVDSKNIFIHSSGDRLIATLGVEDLVIVENNDSILVQKKGRSEGMREVMKLLERENRKEANHSLIVHRPWGRFEILIEQAAYKVKKITVYPGSKLSLQSHFHRVEHWVVVRGVAKIINGDRSVYLRENESTFIPSMTKHRLENPGLTDLEIIEVQTGIYTGEDDIVRHDDDYDRVVG